LGRVTSGVAGVAARSIQWLLTRGLVFLVDDIDQVSLKREIIFAGRGLSLGADKQPVFSFDRQRFSHDNRILSVPDRTIGCLEDHQIGTEHRVLRLAFGIDLALGIERENALAIDLDHEDERRFIVHFVPSNLRIEEAVEVLKHYRM
jgi:hypothetical protein